MQQAITLTNVDQILRYHKVSLSHNELSSRILRAELDTQLDFPGEIYVWIAWLLILFHPIMTDFSLQLKP